MTEAPKPNDAHALAAAAAIEAERYPGSVELLLHAAGLFLQADEIALAVGYARTAVAINPADFRAVRTLSGILAAAGERAEAIRIGLDAIRLNPSDAEVRLHVGGLLLNDQRWLQASEHLSVHVVSAGATPLGWRLLSSALHHAGDRRKAIDAAAQAIAADSNHIEYRLHLASLLCAQGQYSRALEELEIALAQAPDHATVWRAKSSVEAAMGRLSDALRAAERAVALDATDAESQANLLHVGQLCQVPVNEPVLAGDAVLWQPEPRRTAHHTTPRRRGFLADVAVRWQVIYAIILRDIRTRFGHTKLGYLWAIMEPMSHLATLGTMFYLINQAPPPLGDSMFLFYITGLIPYLMFSHVSYDVMGVVDGGGVMMQLPIVKRTDVIVAHSLRQLATELVVGITIFSISGLLGHQAVPGDLLTAGAAVALLWLLATGIGCVNVVIAGLFPSYETLYAALTRVLYFASGIYYTPIVMPAAIREWLTWNPVLQAIEMFRSGFYHQYDPHWLDVNYLTLWAVGSVTIGFALERALRHKMPVHA